MTVINKIKDIKDILKENIEYNSIKVTGNGKIEITCRFKPFELMAKNDQHLSEIINNIKNKLNILLDIKYKVVKMQKYPTLCYNKYVQLINNSVDDKSKNKYKKYLKFFRYENNHFVKSYSEINITFAPIKELTKTEFILAINKIMDNE